jgi:hypothetical protein
MATISNLFINQGADFSTTVTINGSDGSALDLTDYSAIAQIRKSFDSSSYTSMGISFNGDRTTGKIDISLTNSQTSSLEWGRYVWDLLITDGGGDKTRVVEGVAVVSPSVSRS